MSWCRRPPRREAELDEEIRTHLAMAARDREARGETAEDAAAAAHREFGNIAHVKEATRASWGARGLLWLGQDLRYALRALLRSPAFCAVAVLSLGLGIGANTVAFSVIDGFLRRRLPVPEPGRLVYLREQGWSSRPTDDLGYPTYLRLRDESRTFAGLAVENVYDRSPVTLGTVDAGRARVAVVSGNYFSVMRVQPQAGRLLAPEDDGALLAHPVAVLSDAAWTRWLARAPDVVGRTVSFNGTTYTITGVTPPGFQGDWVGRPVDIYVPFAMHQAVLVEVPNPLTGPDARWLHILGRLAPDVTLAQAEADVQVIYQRDLLEQAGPNPDAETRAQMAKRRLYPVAAEHGYSEQRAALAQPITILTLVVVLMLAIACANIAGLLLARAAAREREMAVRLALGAGRGRLARQLLTESVLLAALGGVLGIGLALWGTRALGGLLGTAPVQMFFARSSWLAFELPLSLRALGFTLALCLATGVIFGLAPALRGSDLAPAPTLMGRSAGLSRSRLRGTPGRALVVVQVALTLVVLIAASLFLRTLHNLRTQGLGYSRESVLLAWTTPSGTARGNDPTALRNLWTATRQRLATIPGVVSVGQSNQGVLNGFMPVTTQGQIPILIAGEEPKTVTASMFRTFVTPGFFGAMGIPILAGRDFTEQDTDSMPRVMIISQSMARFYFGAADPVGRQVRMGARDSTGATIIGVVGDLVSGTPRGVGVPQMLWYLNYRDKESQRRIQIMMVAVRTAGNPAGLESRIRQELAAVDPRLPVLKINTVTEQLDDVLAQDRLVAGLAAFFGVLTVLLACLGVYGLLAYTTARRTAELGVRMALGATRGGLLRLVVKESVWLAGAGVLLGIPATLATAGLIRSRLFGVGPGDPITLVGAALLMVLVAVVAALVPALRAASVDPIAALRSE